MEFVLSLANFLWSYVIAYVLIGVGLLLTFRFGAPQIQYFKRGFRIMKKSMKSSQGGISGFATLCSAVGGQVGTGCLVGVASALAAGGPGAIFWMWVTALFGMVITFTETILGQLFRVKNTDGTYRGGAAYYIVKSAFSQQAAMGGIAGHTVMQAFRHGMARGLFSNDAGNGFAALIHATADVPHPVEQGLLSMIGTFITTVIICSMTAFAILFTGALSTGTSGINLVQEAFYSAIGPVGKWVVFFAMFLFGFTSILADIFIGETNIAYIFPKNYTIPIWIYRIVFIGILIVSCIISLDAVWAFIDTLVAGVVFINLFAVLKLSKYANYTFADYKQQLQSGNTDPTFSKDIDILSVNLNDKK